MSRLIYDVGPHMQVLMRFRESLNEEKLRGARKRLWYWFGISVGCMGILLAAAFVCDTLKLRYATSLIFFGSIATCVTFALFMLLCFVDAVADTILSRPPKFFRIVGSWLFNGFLIVLFGLMGVGILAGLFTQR